MATILHLAQQNQVLKLEPELSWREQEERSIYVFPKARQWLERDLPDEVSDRFLEISPMEQVDELVNRFCSGAELTFERQFRPIRHITNGVWELKTADVRLFGWFPHRDCFVCTNGDTKFRIKEYQLVPAYRDEAVRLRNELDLDEPKYLPGDDPNVVVSAFCYPPS